METLQEQRIRQLQIVINYLSSIICPINWTPVASEDLHFLIVELRHKLALARKERDKFVAAILDGERILEEAETNQEEIKDNGKTS